MPIAALRVPADPIAQLLVFPVTPSHAIAQSLTTGACTFWKILAYINVIPHILKNYVTPHQSGHVSETPQCQTNVNTSMMMSQDVQAQPCIMDYN